MGVVAPGEKKSLPGTLRITRFNIQKFYTFLTLRLCFVRIAQQTSNFTLHNISRLVLYNRSGEFTARYALSPCIKQTRLVYKG